MSLFGLFRSLTNPPESTRHTDALAWRDAELRRLRSEGRSWGPRDQYTTGTLKFLSTDNLTAHEPIVLPSRHSIKGEELYCGSGSVTGISAGPDWDHEGRAVIEVERAEGNKNNWDGNPCTHIHNLYVYGAGRANGLHFGGAQSSSLRNVGIHGGKEIGLWILPGSRSMSLWDLDIRNGELFGDERAARGTGLYVRKTGGVISGGNLSLHWCNYGLNCQGVKNLTLSGINFEKVLQPIRLINETSNVILHGVDLQTAGNVLIDLTGNHGDIEIKGTIRRGPFRDRHWLPDATFYYLDGKGEKQRLCGGTQSHKGIPFSMRVEGKGDGQRVNVEVNR